MSMTDTQVQWAAQHDWFVREASEYGERGVWCCDRDSDGREWLRDTNGNRVGTYKFEVR